MAYFRSLFDPFSRKQRPIFLEAEIVDNSFQWDVLKNMRQIKSYVDMFQAVQKILKIRILTPKFLQNQSFFLFFLKCFDLSCTTRKDTTIYIGQYHLYSYKHYISKKIVSLLLNSER